MNLSTKISREQFLQESNARLERVKAQLEQLHGAPPCLFAIDIQTMRSWPESQQVETREHIKDLVAQAEAIVEQARQERALLWEQSEADESDRELPHLIQFTQLREDLNAYEDVFRYVHSLQRS